MRWSSGSCWAPNGEVCGDGRDGSSQAGKKPKDDQEQSSEQDGGENRFDELHEASLGAEACGNNVCQDGESDNGASR